MSAFEKEMRVFEKKMPIFKKNERAIFGEKQQVVI